MKSAARRNRAGSLRVPASALAGTSQDYRFDQVCWNTNDSHLVFHLLRNTRPCLYWVITLICHFLYGPPPRLYGTADFAKFLRSATETSRALETGKVAP